jgi:peptidoglycan/xylan/chitin deacetylase (PgdA/CDA1 family)
MSEQSNAAPNPLLPELDQRPVPRRRVRHRFVILVCTLLSVTLVAGIFAASFVYNWWLDNHTAQVVTPATTPESADIAAYRAFAADPAAEAPAPIVLTYHNLAPGPGGGRYTVTPQDFEAQMQMLSDAGYQSITADQFVAYMKGTWHPSGRTVLITFDDGTSGLWVYGDAILKRYHFHGVGFLIAKSVNTNRPYYLSWRQVQRMSESGRWSFGSHTSALHYRAATGTDGQERPVLTNRLNLGGSQRESLAAFEQRVRTDLTQSKTTMTEHGLPTPRLFAWPFSSLVHRATDPAAARYARTLVQDMFAANFSNPASNPRPVTRRDIAIGVIERLEVMDSTSARELFDEMARMQTLPPSAAPDPLTDDPDWLPSSSQTTRVSIRGDELAVSDSRSRFVKLDWAPQRTADWTDYSASVTTTGLGPGVTGGLRVRVGSPAELALRASATRATVQDASGTAVGTFKLASNSHHTLTMTVSDTATVASVDGTVVLTIPTTHGPLSTGGVGVVTSRPDASTPLAGFGEFHVSAR